MSKIYNWLKRAALYRHETGTELNQALKYIQKVTTGEKPLFFQVYREALILRDLNQNKEALSVAKKSLKLSEEAQNKDFIHLSKKLITELK